MRDRAGQSGAGGRALSEGHRLEFPVAGRGRLVQPSHDKERPVAPRWSAWDPLCMLVTSICHAQGSAERAA